MLQSIQQWDFTGSLTHDKPNATSTLIKRMNIRLIDI